MLTTPTAPARDAALGDHRPPAGLPGVAWLPIMAVVAMKLFANAVFAGRYGWHMDELYYADAARHLDWAFVDYPPLVPLIAAAGNALGGSLAVLRALASLAGAGFVVVTALVARELGGRRWAQAVAALCAFPLALASNSMFQTVSFDQLAWALVLWAAVRVLRTGSNRAWAALALAGALAVETKWTSLALLAGLAAGFALTARGRERLNGPGPWMVGAALALVAVPLVVWEVRHGWASVHFFRGRNGEVRADDPPLKFLLETVLYAGPSAALIWWRGTRQAFRRRAEPALGVALAVVVLGLLASGGKAYYAAPVLVLPWALGAVASEQRGRPGRRRVIAATIAITAVAVVPWLLPVLPARTTVGNDAFPLGDDFGREVGWPELTAQVATIWHRFPEPDRADTAVFGSDYGIAGAIARWGPRLGLPAPVSGALTWRWWGPGPAGGAHRLLVVGEPPDWLLGHGCRTAVVLDHVRAPHGFESEETGQPIVSCTLRAPLRVVWAELAHLD